MPILTYTLLTLALWCSFFFFNDTATTEIYTLSLHDALPISVGRTRGATGVGGAARCSAPLARMDSPDRKSTRLNSSHGYISYAVFCLKKKKKEHIVTYKVHQTCI